MKGIEKKYLITAIVIFIVALITPVLIYLLNFGGNGFSDDPKDWSDFAGFFGGTVNTIIAFISLLVLATLTYFIGENSNDQNKKINILIRKLDAYNEFTSFLPKLYHMLPTLSRKIKTNTYLLGKHRSLDDPKVEESFKDIIREVDLFLKFHFELVHFNLRHGQLFDYDFTNKKYKELENLSYEFKPFFQDLMMRYSLLETSSAEWPKWPADKVERYLELINKFATDLRRELE